MAKSVYVASTEGFTGKSSVALGILDQLSRRVGKVGVFRPILRDDTGPNQRDYVLDLLTSHEAVQLTYEECAGLTIDELHGSPGEALNKIVARYHQVADQCDAVVVAGSDYTDVSAPTEFAFNARIAANLGAPVLLVINGNGRTPKELQTVTQVALAELEANHGTLFAVIANRVDPDALGENGELTSHVLDTLAPGDVPAYAIPNHPLLSAPALRDLMAACEGRMISGEPGLLDLEATGLVVAAMTLPHVLDHLVEGAVVITPGDRAEIVLGVLSAHASSSFPQIAGVVLNGGFELPSQVSRLIEGMGATLPILATDMDTHATSVALSNVRKLTPDSPRKVETALSLFAEHVDSEALLDRLELSRTEVVTPLMFEHMLMDRAASDRRHIVLPEGDEERVLRATDILLRRGVAELTLLGDPTIVAAKAAALGVDVGGAHVVSTRDPDLVKRFAEEYYEMRKHKGVDLEDARDLVMDPSYFGTMMVKTGLADGMVSGAVHTTAETIRPALQVVKTVPGMSVVSSVFLMCLANQVLVYGDCAVNPDPTAEQLADIAISSAGTASAFGIEPRVAMLSYSTGSSGTGTDVEKVTRATALVRERAPELAVEGPIQYDAAIDAAVAATKLPDSPVAGRATVFIFPDLNTGNNTYKAVQRSAGAVAIGPVLQGLRSPVNDLSRGALVRDIVNTVAITAIQGQI